MPMIQPNNGSSPNELLQAAAQLNSAELEKFISAAIALHAKRQAKNLSTKESELLPKINRGIDPKIQERFNTLIIKRRNESLAHKEHLELLRLTTQIEKADAKRVENVAELAQIKQKSFDEIAVGLGIGQMANRRPHF